MNSNPQDFEKLLKVIALKRHEQPPPLYLDQLSRAIRTRIEHGEGRMNMWERLSANFSLRPSLAYAFGLIVCGALGLSAFYMVRQEAPSAEASSSGMALTGLAPAEVYASQLNKPAAPPLHVANWLGNTNPSAETQPEPSLFDTTHTVRSVSYQSGY